MKCGMGLVNWPVKDRNLNARVSQRFVPQFLHSGNGGYVKRNRTISTNIGFALA